MACFVKFKMGQLCGERQSFTRTPGFAESNWSTLVLAHTLPHSTHVLVAECFKSDYL